MRVASPSGCVSSNLFSISLQTLEYFNNFYRPFGGYYCDMDTVIELLIVFSEKVFQLFSPF